MRRLGTVPAALAVVAMAIAGMDSAAAGAFPAKLMICVSNPNDAIDTGYTFKVFPAGPGLGTLAQVESGADGKVGCLSKPLGFKGGAYTIEFFNSERFNNDKNARNSRITKLVIKNKGAKSKVAKLPKKQGESVTTSIMIPAKQLTTLTYTTTIARPYFPR